MGASWPSAILNNSFLNSTSLWLTRYLSMVCLASWGVNLLGTSVPCYLTLEDDPVLANDPSRNNDFDYSSDSGQDQRCPFATHIRKGNPRSDLKYPGRTTLRRMWRQGIPFGPEVTEEERRQARTLHRRGLLLRATKAASIMDPTRCVSFVWSWFEESDLLIESLPSLVQHTGFPTQVSSFDHQRFRSYRWTKW
jgi:hypothetical protein